MSRSAIGVVLLALAAPAAADPAGALRDAAEAAQTGDWPRVRTLTAPLADDATLAAADRGEANRLAGLAAFYEQRPRAAELHFLAYLRVDREALLDPALYPPDVVAFFNDVRLKHKAELRPRPVLAPRWYANLLPPLGQLQNGERGKAIAVGAALAGFAVINAGSYLAIRARCDRVSGPDGDSAVCDGRPPQALLVVNVLAGIGLISSYVYGVYDGFATHRRRVRIAPYIQPATVGVAGSF